MRTDGPGCQLVRISCAHRPWFECNQRRILVLATQFCKGIILAMHSRIQGAIAFAELLSCGFATIGVRATLVAIALQLIDDTLFTLSGHQLSTEWT
jgi:hypothetical protein